MSKDDDLDAESTSVAITPKPRPPVPASAAQEITEEDDEYLRGDAVLEFINANLPKGTTLPKIPRGYMFKLRELNTAKVAIDSVFELMGGVPRMVLWADANETEYYKIFAASAKQMTPAGPMQGVQINLNSAIPINDLDAVSINEDGTVIDIRELP